MIIFVEKELYGNAIKSYLFLSHGIEGVTMCDHQESSEMGMGKIIICELSKIGQGGDSLSGKRDAIVNLLKNSDKGLFILDANSCIEDRDQAYRDNIEGAPEIESKAALYLMPDGKNKAVPGAPNTRDEILKYFVTYNTIRPSDTNHRPNERYWEIVQEYLVPLKHFLRKHLTNN